MEKLSAGSGDCLTLVFNCMNSLKDKVRLESVCKTFRKHARSFAAWSSVTSLVVEDEGKDHLINDDIIPTRRLKSAIEAIVIRSRNIQVIDLHGCKLPIAYSSVARTISKQGAASYRNVKELYLFGHRSLLTSSLHIAHLVHMFKDQLQTLNLFDIRFKNSSDMTRFWNDIGKCVNLKTGNCSEKKW